MALTAAAAASIGAGLGLVGSAGNIFMQKDQQRFNSAEAAKAREFTANENALARDFNSSEAAIARDWQERMSSTAMQRQVSDMKAAGLNVGALGAGSAGSNSYSAAQGAAGSTPYSTPANSGSSNIGSIFTNAISSAIMANGNAIGRDIGKRLSSMSRSNAMSFKQYDDYPMSDSEIDDLLEKLDKGLIGGK